MLNKIWN